MLKQNLINFNIFIIKPGEDTNRGNGIIIAQDINTIKQTLNENLYHKKGKQYTYIVYIL